MPTMTMTLCTGLALTLLAATAPVQAAAPATPAYAVSAPMGAAEARILLNRTSFGGTEQEVAEFAQLSRAAAVDRLLRGTLSVARTAPPAWVDNPITPPREIRDMDPERRKDYIRGEIMRGVELRTWWVSEMLTTTSPLTEKMTLFWHNTFVSSQQKVKYSQLMYRQNVLLRKNALGNYGTLLHAVSRDPAMLIYLDSANSRKGTPNENYAREVMELFSLGEGHYSEQDIKEAARAFTGWSVEPQTGDYKWRPFFHDDGVKTVLGRTSNFDGDAVLDVILAQPACAEYIVGRMWREFVAPEPDPAEVRRIAAEFRASRYDIKTALRDILTSNAMYATENRANLIKSPVDLVVGTLRQFQFTVPDPLPFALNLAQLGQNLMSPPNVKGWPGGEAWINSTTLLARKQFAERVFRLEEMPQMARNIMAEGRQQGAGVKGAGRALGEAGRERFVTALTEIRFDPNAWLSQVKGPDPTQAVEVAMLAMPPVTAPASGTQGIALIRALALDPTYQLK
jgi:uncharacterized protein (DUF1800 family)